MSSREQRDWATVDGEAAERGRPIATPDFDDLLDAIDRGENVDYAIPVAQETPAQPEAAPIFEDPQPA